MTPTKIFLSLALITAVVYSAAGCALPTPPALTQARITVEQAERDPELTGNAPVALYEAQQSLRSAEDAWQRNQDEEEARHLAYLTERRVDIARARAARSASQKEIKLLNEERQAVIIESRELEIARRQQEAQVSLRQARESQARAEAAKIEASERAREAALAQQSAAKMRAEAELARKEAQQAGVTAKELEEQLKALQAKVKDTERGMVLTLGDVLFEFDMAELKAGALRNLYPLVSFLKENSSQTVKIEGHTDSVGSNSYNLDLSRRRAEAVARFLTENDIAPQRVQAQGMGKAYPVAANDSAQGRQLNRRVEIIFPNKERD